MTTGYIGEGVHASNLYVDSNLSANTLTVRSGSVGGHLPTSTSVPPGTTRAVTADESGTIFLIDLSAGDTTLTLPPAAVGLHFKFFIVDATANNDFTLSALGNPSGLMYGSLLAVGAPTGHIFIVNSTKNVRIRGDQPTLPRPGETLEVTGVDATHWLLQGHCSASGALGVIE